MPTSHVYMVEPSYDRNKRPGVNFDVAENDQGITKLRLHAMSSGDRSMAGYRPVTLIPSAEIDNWDYFGAGTVGLMSQKATQALGPYMERCFEFVEVYIVDHSFFLVRTKFTFDCLDRERSEVILSSDDPNEVIMITEYVFRKTIIPDPFIFAIPEVPVGMFGTDSILEVAAKARLRGFGFPDVEVVGPSGDGAD